MRNSFVCNLDWALTKKIHKLQRLADFSEKLNEIRMIHPVTQTNTCEVKEQLLEYLDLIMYILICCKNA